MKRLLLVLFTVCACVACNAPSSPKFLKTPQDVVDWRLTPQGDILLESSYILYKNREEIKRTCSIAEVKEAGSLRVIFYSYSIGATIYRKVEICKMIDGYYFLAWGDSYEFENYNSYNYKNELAKKYGCTADEIVEIAKAAKDWQPDEDDIF